MALKSDQKFSCSASANFELAKAVSIFMVVAGHFYGPSSWPLVTVALCIFGFSSAYFTDKKYAEGTLDGYWKSKFNRLFFRVIIINCFLIIVLLVKNKQGIFSWHSLVHIVGGTGFLNWFNIVDKSPLGDGLWFFTLLLIFYIVYPLGRKIWPKYISWWTIILCYIFILLMQTFLPMGHMLWLTIFSFISGIFFYRKKDRLRIKSIVFIIFILLILFFVLNISKYKEFNFFIISNFSIICCVFFVNLELKIPKMLAGVSRFINAHMVEIYFIHGYLFCNVFSNQLINFVLSILLISSVAILLLKISVLIQKLVMSNHENSPYTRS